MATNSMIPYSNPAGNNQTTPGAGAVSTPVAPSVPTVNPTQPAAAAVANPLIPAAVGTAMAGTGTAMNVGGVGNNQGATQTQLSNIYGQGVGTDLTNLVSSIGGTDSATLQEYIASLAPQEAQAGANLNASLGAGGVSANSSVAALGQANLQAQEMATVAGESANLTQSGQALEANILQGTEQAAATETAESGWNVFGDVLTGVGNLAGQTIAAAGKAGGFSNLFS